MMDKSFHPISDSTHEKAETVDASHDQNSYIPPANSAARLLSKELISAASSASPSRESSPIRPIRPHFKKPQSARYSVSGQATSLKRPRKNSSQEISPNKSTIPISTAATQRTLSASSIPVLQALSPDQTQKLPSSQTSVVANDVREYSRWPISPRLRSPPPNVHPTLPLRNLDFELSSKPSKVSYPDDDELVSADSDPDELSYLSGMRTPARGVSGASSTLETVQEISRPGTPTSQSGGDLEKLDITIVRRTTDSESLDEISSPTLIKQKASISANESGNESSGKGEVKQRVICTGLPGAIRSSGTSTKSFMSTGLGRVKPSGEAFSRNMTVETETVSSVSQVSVGLSGPGNAGSIRTKPSSETIRPRKEKKKTIRKPPSITSGTGKELIFFRSRIYLTIKTKIKHNT